MDANPTFLIGAGLLLIFVIWMLVKSTSNVKPMSKEDGRQHEIIQDISKRPNPSSGFSFGKLLFLIFVIILIVGAIFIASKGGLKFP